MGIETPNWSALVFFFEIKMNESLLLGNVHKNYKSEFKTIIQFAMNRFKVRSRFHSKAKKEGNEIKWKKKKEKERRKKKIVKQTIRSNCIQKVFFAFYVAVIKVIVRHSDRKAIDSINSNFKMIENHDLIRNRQKCVFGSCECFEAQLNRRTKQEKENKTKKVMRRVV